MENMVLTYTACIFRCVLLGVQGRFFVNGDEHVDPHGRSHERFYGILCRRCVNVLVERDVAFLVHTCRAMLSVQIMTMQQGMYPNAAL